MKLSWTQTFEAELELANPQQHAKQQLLTQVYQVLDKIFTPQREVCAIDETVCYTLDFNIIANHELQQIIQNSYNMGITSGMPRILH
jgi:hypothetical protein